MTVLWRVLGLVVSAGLMIALVAQPAQARDDTATVCRNTANTAQTGLQQFVGQMQQASSQLGAGDLTGAQASVQQASATLRTTANQLTQQASAADDPAVKTAVGNLAAELNSLSGQLTTVSGLETLDSTRLEQLAQAMAQLCGSSAPFPGPSSSVLPSRTN